MASLTHFFLFISLLALTRCELDERGVVARKSFGAMDGDSMIYGLNRRQLVCPTSNYSPCEGMSLPIFYS
jgi:hypothetical protein